MDKQKIIETIKEVIRSRHPYVIKAELFGSLARGDNQIDSDVDLILLYDENRPRGFEALGIHLDLEENIGRKVDIVQDHLLHDFVKKNILSDRELIYVR